jgi:uncharacterized protein YbjQ (UPF0145 family)
VAVSLLLGGCTGAVIAVPSTVELSPAQTAAAGEVTVFRAGAKAAPTRFTKKGTVKGYACNMVVTDPATAYNRAVEHAKYSAALLGADAVIGFSCTLAGTENMCPDCWNCAQCDGTAVTITREGPS